MIESSSSNRKWIKKQAVWAKHGRHGHMRQVNIILSGMKRKHLPIELIDISRPDWSNHKKSLRKVWTEMV